MKKEKIQQIIQEALGKTAALFTTQEKRGIDIVMPTDELLKIAEKTIATLCQKK